MSIWQRQYNLTMPEYKKVIQISNWIIENVLEIYLMYLKMPISLSGARTHESILEQYIFRSEIEKYFRSFFGSNENSRICFRD